MFKHRADLLRQAIEYVTKPRQYEPDKQTKLI